MNTVNLNWNEESKTSSTTSRSFEVFQKTTIAFLLLSCVVSVYEALYLVGSGSQFFYPLLAGGFGRIVVAIYCAKGSDKALQVASAFAVITSAIDLVSSGRLYFATILYIVPQAFVVLFSRLALVRKPDSPKQATSLTK